MIETGVISSQLLLRHEKRMTLSVIRLNAALAREIDAGWSILPMPMLTEALTRWRSHLADLLFRFHETIARDGIIFIQQLAGQKNEALDFLLNFIRPELRRHGQQQAALIEGYLRQRIIDELASGRSSDEVRQAIAAILKSKGYAQRIAHTEAHTALERGAYEAADSLGVRITKAWWSREDSVVRPDHARAHGQVREINQPFLVGGELLLYPGVATASAKQRVNCRCTVQYKLH